jgi:hypothetical protein
VVFSLNVDLDEVAEAQTKVTLVIKLGPGEGREESEGRGSDQIHS